LPRSESSTASAALQDGQEIRTAMAGPRRVGGLRVATESRSGSNRKAAKAAPQGARGEDGSLPWCAAPEGRSLLKTRRRGTDCEKCQALPKLGIVCCPPPQWSPRE